MADIEIAEVSVTTLAKEMITKPKMIPVSKYSLISKYKYVVNIYLHIPICKCISGVLKEYGVFVEDRFHSRGIGIEK